MTFHKPTVLNTAFPLRRDVYNVIPTNRETTAPWSTVFVDSDPGPGNTALICQQAAVIQNQGFGIVANCGGPAKATRITINVMMGQGLTATVTAANPPPAVGMGDGSVIFYEFANGISSQFNSVPVGANGRATTPCPTPFKVGRVMLAKFEPPAGGRFAASPVVREIVSC